MHSSAVTTPNLFMYVDGVKSPLVVLQHRRGGHCFIVLGADDDDDQIPLLYVKYTTSALLQSGPGLLRFTVI